MQYSHEWNTQDLWYYVDSYKKNYDIFAVRYNIPIIPAYLNNIYPRRILIGNVLNTSFSPQIKQAGSLIQSPRITVLPSERNKSS